MKLVNAHVTNYRNIIDSNEVEIGATTCLVGKNEAGKPHFSKRLKGSGLQTRRLPTTVRSRITPADILPNMSSEINSLAISLAVYCRQLKKRGCLNAWSLTASFVYHERGYKRV
jgi:hypothetical protein